MSIQKPKTVLICEDDEVCRRMLRVRLEKYGYEIVGEAVTGLQAINLFADKNPEMVLLDIEMPKGNGLTVLRLLREMRQPCRIVMLTVDNSRTTVENARKLGADDYIIKSSLDKPRFLEALDYQETGDSEEEEKRDGISEDGTAQEEAQPDSMNEEIKKSHRRMVRAERQSGRNSRR